ncbi:MAG: N-acetylmuramoyl-L-alanine amidase, partial [Acidimicrobiales bacterium]
MAASIALSPNVSPGRRGPILWVVLHTMEVAYDTPTGAARWAARWFADPQSGVSGHCCVDRTDLITCVDDTDTAWAARSTGNVHGLHLEFAGFAAEGRDTWLGRRSMLRLGAVWLADRCRRHGLPLSPLGPAELAVRAAGVTTHAAVSEAFRESEHTDPGAGFPVDELLRLAALAQGPWPGRVLRSRSPRLVGDDVGMVQARLVLLGYDPGVADGVFGAATAAAAQAFQQSRGLVADGAV